MEEGYTDYEFQYMLISEVIQMEIQFATDKYKKLIDLANEEEQRVKNGGDRSKLSHLRELVREQLIYISGLEVTERLLLD